MHGRTQTQEETRAAVLGHCKEDRTKTSGWAGEEQLARAGGEDVCMHDHIDSICVLAWKLGSNGEMSGWSQASAGRQARQWLAGDSAESLPTTWSGPVIAFRPCRNMVTKIAWSQAIITDSSRNREG